MAELPSPREVAKATTQSIAEAAKWMIGAFAAVGAALIAGSQLSNIGKLDPCFHLTVDCTRLFWAVGGTVLGLTGVVWAIWTAVLLLVPEKLPLGELKSEWAKGDRSVLRKYFENNASYLQGFSDLADIGTKKDEAFRRFDEAQTAYDEVQSEDEKQQKLAAAEERKSQLEDVLARADAVLTHANHVLFMTHFRKRALRRMLTAAAISAIGIGVFAWAANPSEGRVSASLRGANLANSDLTGANLRSVDLTEADLSGSNLSGADLTGADLEEAKLDGVKWSKTICPDGKKSDDVGNTCLNHLEHESLD